MRSNNEGGSVAKEVAASKVKEDSNADSGDLVEGNVARVDRK